MTKKLFGTDGVRGVANVYPMTAEFAVKLGMACGQEICCNKRRAAIGRDTRISGEMLEAGLTAGLTAAGIDVVKLGVLPTPAVTSVTPELGYHKIHDNFNRRRQRKLHKSRYFRRRARY